MTTTFSVYYHIYLTDSCHWADFLVNQFAAALDAGVLQQAKRVSVTAIGAPEDWARIVGLLDYYGKLLPTKPELDWHNKQIKDTELLYLNSKSQLLDETLTLRRLWQEAQSHDRKEAVLYFHAKGITALQKTVLQGENYAHFVNYAHWRRLLEWSVLERQQACRQLLETYDTVGANFCVWPSPHYSGNFWWANTDYIRKLPDPTDITWFNFLGYEYPIIRHSPQRMMGELWLGAHRDARMASLFNHPHPPPESNLVESYIDRTGYVKD
jgi:hypothetical protein